MDALFPSGRTLAPPRSPAPVLALAAPTADGANAAWRAGLVARDRGTALRLLHVQPDAHGLAAAEAAMQELAMQLRQKLHLDVTAGAASGGLRECVARAAPDAGLVVLPSRRGHRFVEAMLGPYAERVYRALRKPLLVVRQPALTSYRRVLVPVKLDADAVPLIAAARSVSRDPRMRVFHVLDTALEGAMRMAGASERGLRLQRQHRSNGAYAALNELILRSGAHEEGATALVSAGHVPARVLEIAAGGNAQLVVAGKERRSALSDFLFGGITQRLLLEAEADVLVLPLAQGAPAPATGDLRLQPPVA